MATNDDEFIDGEALAALLEDDGIGEDTPTMRAIVQPSTGEVTASEAPTGVGLLDVSEFGQASFKEIYLKAGVLDRKGDFTVYRVEELLGDPDIAKLDDTGRASAIRVLLRTHDVEVSDVIEDARKRVRAIKGYDKGVRTELQAVHTALTNANEELEAEIEAFTKQRRAKIQLNVEKMEKAQGLYDTWRSRRKDELARIRGVAAHWAEEAIPPETSGEVETGPPPPKKKPPPPTPEQAAVPPPKPGAVEVDESQISIEEPEEVSSPLRAVDVTEESVHAASNPLGFLVIPMWVLALLWTPLVFVGTVAFSHWVFEWKWAVVVGLSPVIVSCVIGLIVWKLDAAWSFAYSLVVCNLLLSGWMMVDVQKLAYELDQRPFWVLIETNRTAPETVESVHNITGVFAQALYSAGIPKRDMPPPAQQGTAAPAAARPAPAPPP